MNHDGAVVVDISESAEFENGHIPAAINIPLGQLDSSLNRLKKYRDKKKPIVLTCKTGTRAGRAAAILRKNEFSDVYTLAGGLAAWEKENLPVER
jgi:rhodanese-related sulfurtransferase